MDSSRCASADVAENHSEDLSCSLAVSAGEPIEVDEEAKEHTGCQRPPSMAAAISSAKPLASGASKQQSLL